MPYNLVPNVPMRVRFRSLALPFFIAAILMGAVIGSASADVMLPIETVRIERGRTPIGQGVVVRDGEFCFVVTPAHVADSQQHAENLEDRFRLVYAFSKISGGVSLQLVIANDKDDVYVGLVPDGMLSPSCSKAPQIADLDRTYNYFVSLGREREFKTISLISPITEMLLEPKHTDALRRLENGDELQYIIHDCDAASLQSDCNKPVKGMSGSPLWYFGAPQSSQPVFLGLHRQRCDADCDADGSEFWKGITVDTISKLIRLASQKLGHMPTDMAPASSPLALNTAPKDVDSGVTTIVEIQRELSRLNCDPGVLDGVLGDGTRHAMLRAGRAYEVTSAAPFSVDSNYLQVLRSLRPKACPSMCNSTEHFKDGKCRPIARKTISKPAAVPKKTSKCETINGLIHCK